jgi:hypothetical protein
VCTKGAPALGAATPTHLLRVLMASQPTSVENQ